MDYGVLNDELRMDMDHQVVDYRPGAGPVVRAPFPCVASFGSHRPPFCSFVGEVPFTVVATTAEPRVRVDYEFLFGEGPNWPAENIQGAFYGLMILCPCLKPTDDMQLVQHWMFRCVLGEDGAPVSTWLPELGSRAIRALVMATPDVRITFTTRHFQS
jgi:hypothetical protein